MGSTPEENFYRVAHLILDEIPIQLRKYFKSEWNAKYPQAPWGDSLNSGQLFLQRKGNIKDKTIINRIQNGDSNEWDGTTLFAVLLFSGHNLFADPNARTCIDDLRQLRNKCYAHLDSAKIEDPDYQQIIQDVKNTFMKMKWSVTKIIVIETKILTTHDVQKLLNDMLQEGAYNKQLENELNLIKDVEQLKKNSSELKEESGFITMLFVFVISDSLVN